MSIYTHLTLFYTVYDLANKSDSYIPSTNPPWVAKASLTYASDTLFNVFYTEQTVDCVPNPSHWNHLKKGSLSGQYEQEE